MADDVKIKISGDASEYASALNAAKNATDQFGNQLTSLATKFLTFTALYQGITKSVVAFGEAENATRRLNLALENSGTYSKDLSEAFQKEAEELSKLTGIDDDAIIGLNAKLVALTKVEAQTKGLTKAVVDLAVANDKDLESTAELVAKGINGHTEALNKLGIRIDENLPKHERTNEIIRKINLMYKDSAESAVSGANAWKKIGTEIQNVFEKAGGIIYFWGSMIKNAFTGNMQAASEAYTHMKEVIAGTYSATSTATEATLALKKTAANEEAKLEAQKENDLKRVRDSERDLELLKLKGFSKEIIEIETRKLNNLKKLTDTKNKSIRKDIEADLAEVEAARDVAANIAYEKQKSSNDLLLANNKEYLALNFQEQDFFKTRYLEELTNQTQTEQSMRLQLALDRAKLQAESNNQFLQDEIKYGTAMATIKQTMRREDVQGASKGFSELEQLQQSNYGVLKAIGKAAAIANIVTKTAESAMNVVAGFSTIPIVGPALGIAAAAGIIAYGAERIAKVTTAAQGGIVTGGKRGIDSVPAMLTPGELVVPEKNFDQVVSSYAASKGMNNGAPITIVLKLKDNLMDFIETKITERNRLRLSVQGG